MKFEKIEFSHAFYDDYYDMVFYTFNTVPQIGHGNWAISEGGDVAYNMLNDNVTQTNFPEELMYLLDHIPDGVDIEGYPY